MSSIKKSEKITYNVPEAGEILGIGRSAAYEGARTGAIPTIRIGNRILVPKTALERMLLEAGLPGIDLGAA
jgi:excisionase family DNA binding protein